MLTKSRTSDSTPKLHLDVTILPLADTPFNTKSKSHIRPFELTQSGIPMVTPNLVLYNELIDEQEAELWHILTVSGLPKWQSSSLIKVTILP